MFVDARSIGACKVPCGGCTACCIALAVPWMDSPAGHVCRECIPGEGCRLWPNIPQKCAGYDCAYKQAGAGLSLRPDNLGVVFEKVADTFFLGIAVRGFSLSPLVLGQVETFVRDGFSVVIVDRPKPPMFRLAPGHTQEMLRAVWRREARKVLDGYLRN